MVGLLSLPTELQLQILTYIVQSLDEAPSEAKFDQEPSIHLVRSSNHPLKDLSLVCSELRQLVLPALFEYACINILDQQGEEIKKTQTREPTASVGPFGEWKTAARAKVWQIVIDQHPSLHRIYEQLRCENNSQELAVRQTYLQHGLKMAGKSLIWLLSLASSGI